MMDEKKIIDSAKLFVESLFADDFSGHDTEHTLRVYNNALLIADTEAGKRIAQARHDYIKAFVDEITFEINAEK